MHPFRSLLAAALVAGATALPGSARAADGGWVVHGAAGSRAAVAFAPSGSALDLADGFSVTTTGTYLLLTVNPYVKKPYPPEPPQPPTVDVAGLVDRYDRVPNEPYASNLEFAYLRLTTFPRTGTVLKFPTALAGGYHAIRVVSDGDFEIRLPVTGLTSWVDEPAAYRSDGRVTSTSPVPAPVIHDSFAFPVHTNSVTAHVMGADLRDYVVSRHQSCFSLVPADVTCSLGQSWRVTGSGGPTTPPLPEARPRNLAAYFPGDLPDGTLHATMNAVYGVQVDRAYHLALTVSLDWVGFS